MLQDISKCDHLASSRIQTIPDYLVIRVVCRSDILQSTVIFRLFHMKFQQIKAVIDRKVMPCILQVQRIETGLSLFQSYFHLAGL